MCTSLTVVDQERVLKEKRDLSHPENKPSSCRKPPYNGRETRYRKDLCTRSSGMSRGPQKCSQIPLGVTGRPFIREKRREPPPVYEPLLALMVLKVVNSHPGITPGYPSRVILGLSKPSILVIRSIIVDHSSVFSGF